jgi:hypothetical protein
MTSPAAWHVLAHPDDQLEPTGWRVVREDSKQASRVLPFDEGYTKQDAIDYAEELAEHNAPADIVIHERPIIGRNGNIIHPIQEDYLVE